MFRRKKSPQRLYYPTKSRWYTQPRRHFRRKNTRKLFTNNIKTKFTRFFRNAIYFTITGLVLILLILFLLFSSYFSITNIEVLRKDFHIDTALISNQLNEYIGENILFFQRSKIVNKIQENFPEFSSVQVKKVLPHSIKIELQSYPIVANIRAYYVLPELETIVEDDYVTEVEEALKESFILDEEVSTKKEEITPIEQKCLINEIGQAIFDKEEDLELMTILVTGLTQPIEDREVIITDDKMDYILNSIKYFTNLLTIEVSAIEYLPIAREVHLNTSAGFEVWLTTEKDYREQIDKLNVIYKTAELDAEDMAYVDLRVREKVIYCLSNARCASE